MPVPTRGDVHVTALLTNIAIAHLQAERSRFIADRVFPNVPVLKQSDRYPRYDRADFWRNQFAKRAPSTESAGGGWKIDTSATYFCERWALHKDVDDETRANSDAPIDMDRDASLYLAEQAAISREVEWASKNFTTSVWKGIDGTSGDITGVSASPSTSEVLQWNDSSSNPISDVKTQARNIQTRIGLKPNKLVLGAAVWDYLTEHPDVLDRIKYSGQVGPDRPAIVTERALAQLFGVDEVLVAEGVYATSVENASFETSMTLAQIMGKAALLVYAAPRPSIMEPSGGYTFSWKAFGAGEQGVRIKKFRMENLTSDRVEGEMYVDRKVVCADAGVFFTSIVA